MHQWILLLSSFKENNNKFKSLNCGLPWRNDFRKKGKLKYLVESDKQNRGSMPTSSAIVEAQQDSRSKSTILWNVPNRFGIRRKRSYTAHLRSFENCKALWKLSHFRPRQTHNGQEVVFLHLISKAITKLIMTKRHQRTNIYDTWSYRPLVTVIRVMSKKKEKKTTRKGQ